MNIEEVIATIVKLEQEREQIYEDFRRDARRAPAPSAYRGRAAEALGSAPPARSRQSGRAR